MAHPKLLVVDLVGLVLRVDPAMPIERRLPMVVRLVLRRHLRPHRDRTGVGMSEMAPEAYVPDAVTPECRCGRPTRDSAYFCDDCGHQLSVALGDVPWLDEELDVSAARIKGANYAGTSSKGAETPSPVNWGAAEARADPYQ